MDTIDKKLLALLSQDSRIATSALARELGVSRSTVQGRIDRLCRSGIIERFTIQMNRAFEQSLIRAHVLIKVNQTLTARSLSRLQSLPEVTAIYAVSGEYDFIATVAAQSTAELNRLLDHVGTLDGIARTNSSVILETKLRR